MTCTPLSLSLSLSVTNAAEILYSLNRVSEAECLYRDLIHRNPENYYYFEKLEECIALGNNVCMCVCVCGCVVGFCGTS